VDNDKIKILIADDHKIVRDGLKTLLKSQDDMEIVGETMDGRSTVKAVASLSPDIVIMDIAMPHLNGIEATRQIVNDHPGVKVVALSMHSDKRFVTEMLQAGASAYLLKDCAFEELVIAINAVKNNKHFLSPGITGVILSDIISQGGAGVATAFSSLSSREREVLQLLAEGKTTRQISDQLNVSIKTIETHRTNIMNKLEIFSVAELTKYAIREGLTSL
jgi:DNA-binding NarL/FixJ family response regulator